MNRKSTLFVCAAACIFSLSAQAQTCRAANPTTESLKEIQILQNQAQKSTDRKIIPVVFHVLHQYGPENITDAQILDVLQILNEDFQKLNADSTLVTAPFDTIKGNVNFEFRLATIDPDGNPTGGIDRIPTPLTNVGSQNTLINAWDYRHYVNIWIVKNIDYPGVAGVTSNPLVSNDPCTQGILILHNYVGSIGTGMWAIKHTLTHEMGHYFGLFHTWGDQEVGQSCNYSDGIFDTPVSKGNTSCNTTMNSCDDSNDAASFAYWGFDPRDNVENFMDFSYCLRMFTKGQAELMRNVAESPLYGRNELWTSANLLATGTGPGTAPVSLALPSSDFTVQTGYSNSTISSLTCVGDSVQLLNASGQQSNVSYQWIIPSGSPSVSTLPNPKVVFMNAGYSDITLTVTNANGSTTTTKPAAVFASGNWPDYSGPIIQDFNSSGDFWLTENLLNNTAYFQRVTTGGVQNSGCFLLNNHYDPDTASLCYESSAQQINQSRDHLVSPAFHLANTSNVTVSFDYAYGSAAVPDSATEILKVYYSRDCGRSWILKKTIADTALITAFAPPGSNYLPAANEWKHASFAFNSMALDTKTRFKFEFTASNKSNQFYLDNFVIDGILGISEDETWVLNVYPNPSQGIITISGLGKDRSKICLYDLQGKQVYEYTQSSTPASLQLETGLKSGCYLLEVIQHGSKFRTRVIVE